MRAFLAALPVAISIALVGCGSSGGAKDEGGGGTPFVPQVTGVSLDKSTIDLSVGEKATATLTFVSGASAAIVSYTLDYPGTPRFVKSSFAPGSNSFQLDTNAYFQDGVWTLSPLMVTTATHVYRLVGSAGSNYQLESVTDLAGEPVSLSNSATTIPVRSVTTTNGAVDATPPVVSAVVVSGTGTGTAGAFRVGDTVTIDVTVADSESGVMWDHLGATLRPKSAHSDLVNPSLTTGGTFVLTSGSTYRATLTLTSAIDVYPTDLCVTIQAQDLSSNQLFLTYDSAQSTTKYYDSFASTLSALDIGTVDFEATWPPASIANGSTPITPSSTATSFSIASDATVVHTYAITDATTYEFRLATNDGNTGDYTAKRVIVGLYYADGTVLGSGVLAATRDYVHNMPTYMLTILGFTTTQGGALYVVTRCNSAEPCTPGTLSHSLQ